MTLIIHAINQATIASILTYEAVGYEKKKRNFEQKFQPTNHLPSSPFQKLLQVNRPFSAIIFICDERNNTEKDCYEISSLQKDGGCLIVEFLQENMEAAKFFEKLKKQSFF
uniref:Uncharacterized protein n=1 Tax=Onchocerca volvulus TaxID=6282 RepID=A0A8R1TSU1_ONCVO